MAQLVGSNSLGLGKLIDGKNQFIHIRYSAKPDGSNMTSEIQPDTKYIGIRTSSSETPSINPADYSWGRFVGTSGSSSYTWIRYSANEDGSNMTTIANEDTKYIGVAITDEDSAPTDHTRYSWALFKGSDGRGVERTEVSYQKSTNGVAIPTGSWSTSIPSLNDGEYLWTRTLFTYTDKTTTSTFSVSRNGATGLGISRTDVHYQKSRSGTTAPTGDWSVTIPNVRANEYLWTRTTITYTDDSTSVSYSVGKMGADGRDAQLLYLTASSQIQAFDKDDNPKTTEAITISAKLQNASGTATFVAIPYIGNVAQEPIILGGTGNDRTLLPSQWTGTHWTTIAITATLGSLTDTISVSKVKDGVTGPKGDRGNDGVAGKDGVGLRTTAVTYGLSNSETTQPTSWSEQVPTLTKGKFLWTRTVWTYTDDTTETGYQKTYIARDGNDGADGVPGKDGVGIKSTTITYAPSMSGTTQPTSGWSSQIPSVLSGQYLWTKTVWTYTDGSSETGYSVSRMGERGPQGLEGAQGPKGDQGIPGRPGADGRTSYSHIAYADSADGTKNFSTSDSNRLYIGFYTDFNATDSINPGDYRWSLIKGADGQDGADGAPGRPGADGRTPYFHTAYADSPDGSFGFSTTDSNGKLYLGTCTDYNQNDPTDYRAYTWVKIKGDKGDQGIQGPKGENGQSLYTWVKYADDENGNGMSETPDDKRYIGLAYNKTVATESNNPGDYTWSLIQGENGVNGADGITYYTWIRYADTATGGGLSDNPAGKSYIGLAYNKTTPTESTDPRDYQWSLIKGEPGKTPVIHVAWADSADGSVGFTLEVPAGKIPKYRGYYVNYSTDTSTDPADYKWERNPDDAGNVADDANDKSDLANQLANAAKELANKANVDAAEANRLIGVVNTEIERLDTDVSNAKSDLADAEDYLNSKIETVKTTLTEEYATKTNLSETQITLNKTISESVASVKQEMSETYAAKTDFTELSGDYVSFKEDTAKKFSQQVSSIETVQADTAAAQQMVNEAISKAQSAITNATNASNLANNALNQASNATNTANGASQNAANAVASANNALNSANAAKENAIKAIADVAALTKTVSSQSTRIDQTSNRIEQVASGITEVGNRLDGMSIGGENLINLSEINPYNSATIDKNNYVKRGEVILTKGSGQVYSGLYLNFYNDAKPETYYVLSYDITALDDQPFNTIRGHMDVGFYTIKFYVDGVDTKKDYPSTYPFSDSNVRKHHIEVYIKVKNEMTADRRIFIQPNHATGEREKYKIENLKIVEGNKYTNGWSPAPEDTQDQIDGINNNLSNNYYQKTTVDSKLSTAVSGITAQYTQDINTKLGNYYDKSTIDSKLTIDGQGIATYVKSTKNKLDNLQVGGRNYTLNSNVYIDAPTSILNFQFSNDIFDLRNKKITVSVDVELENAVFNRIGFEPSFIKTDKSEEYPGTWLIYSGKPMTLKKRLSTTWQLNEKIIKAIGQRGMYIQGYVSGKIKIGRPALTDGDGNVWSPAPEDMATLTQYTEVKQLADRISSTVYDSSTGLTTKVNQLAGKYAITALNSAGDILASLNLNANTSTAEINAKLIRLNGSTKMDDAFVNKLKANSILANEITAKATTVVNAKIANLDATNIKSGYLDAQRIKAGSITSDKIKVTTLSAITANLGKVTSGYIGNGKSYWDLATGNFFNTNGSNSSVSIGNGKLIVANKTSFDSSSSSSTSWDSLELGTNRIALGNSSGFLEIRPNTIGIGGSSGSATILSPGGLRFGYDFNATVSWFQGTNRVKDWYDSTGYRYQSGRFDLTNGSFNTTGGAVQITANTGPVNLQGASINIRNKQNSAYVTCYAANFSSQSAYSAKTDFENIDNTTMLQAILKTDIVKYRFKNSNQKYVGFIINDNGRSPYMIDNLLVNDDNSSFSSNTAIGVAYGAIKELNRKLEKLEAENLLLQAKLEAIT